MYAIYGYITTVRGGLEESGLLDEVRELVATFSTLEKAEEYEAASRLKKGGRYRKDSLLYRYELCGIESYYPPEHDPEPPGSSS